MCEAFRTPEKIGPDFLQSTHYFGGVSPSTGILYGSSSPADSNKPEVLEEIKPEPKRYSPNGLSDDNSDTHSNNVHRIFDPSLITNGTTCTLTGVRFVFF
jgi:hypothetical protein